MTITVDSTVAPLPDAFVKSLHLRIACQGSLQLFVPKAAYQFPGSKHKAYQLSQSFLHSVRLECRRVGLDLARGLQWIDITLLPQLRPFRKHALVKRHAHRVHLIYRPVEVRFEIPMRAEGLADVARAPELRVELDGLIVLDII